MTQKAHRQPSRGPGKARLQRSLGIWGLGAIAGLSLVGCTQPQGELGSETLCSAATALATYGWEVAYFPERFRNDSHRHRIEAFASAELLNRNGIQPEGNVLGPDDEGVWWPRLPPRPTAEQLDERRDGTFRDNKPPLLQRNVRYWLDCEEGTFATTDEQYRRLGLALREGKTVRARYALGQLLGVTILEAGATLEPGRIPEANRRPGPLPDTGSPDSGA
jgi:hypothetical protein